MSFEQYLQGKGLSERVIKSYRAEVSRHQRFLDQQGKSPEGATKKDLLDYLQSDSRLMVRHRAVKRPLSNRTKRGILGILNHYYRLPDAAGVGSSEPNPVLFGYGE